MAEQTLSAKEQFPLSGSMPPVLRVFGDLCFHTDGDLQVLAFGPEGHLWSIEDLGVLRKWNPSTGQQLRWTFLSDLETLWAISPDCRLIASAAADLTLWDMASGKILDTMQQPSWVTAIAFGPSDKLLATGHDDGIVRVWDTASGSLAGTLKGHTDRIQALAWHPNGHRLVSGGWDTTARLWNTQTFEPIILLNGHADQVTALAFNPNGSLLACADSADAIHIWDSEAGKSLQVLKEHEAEIRCLTFTPDGGRLASAGADRVIHLWDARQGR